MPVHSPAAPAADMGQIRSRIAKLRDDIAAGERFKVDVTAEKAELAELEAQVTQAERKPGEEEPPPAAQPAPPPIRRRSRRTAP